MSLNFSYPLWFGENRTANLTSNTAFNNSRFASSQIGVNGSLDSENNLNYGVSTTTSTGGTARCGAERQLPYPVDHAERQL
ncbi:fimbria/pilus outer membrane usher protein [Klebsiella michiganensis]|nr:fimbria/pilus outer membrane usher protein [Klebsiella michiganensis]